MEKTYTLPDGTKFIFEYDHNRMGIITLECMDTLMSLLKATVKQIEPQTERVETMSCQECKWWFTDSLKHGGYCQSFLYNQECRYEPQERSK